MRSACRGRSKQCVWKQFKMMGCWLQWARCNNTDSPDFFWPTGNSSMSGKVTSGTFKEVAAQRPTLNYILFVSLTNPPPPLSYKKDRMTTLELFWNISIFQYFEWPLYWTEVPINSSWMTTRVKYTFHLFECFNFPFTRPHKLLGMKFTSMKGNPIYTCGLKSPSLYFETVQL